MFEQGMFDQPVGPQLAAVLGRANPTLLEDDELEEYLAAARQIAGWAHGRLRTALCEFADRRSVNTDDDAGVRLSGPSQPVRFGGEDTPLVDEFAAEELAPILQVAPMTAGHLLGDALDLGARLPWVATALRGGEIDWNAARAIASGTRSLSVEQLRTHDVDRRLYRSALRLTLGKFAEADRGGCRPRRPAGARRHGEGLG